MTTSEKDALQRLVDLWKVEVAEACASLSVLRVHVEAAKIDAFWRKASSLWMTDGQ